MALFVAMALGAVAWEPVSQAIFSGISEGAAGRHILTGPTVSVRFSLCRSGGQQDCVVDGDTLRFGGMIVRVADIDTPEVRDYQCAAEKALGDRATRKLLEVVNAGPFEVAGYARDEDMYGRKLRILKRDGVSLGETLVAEGLARRWDGSRHSWC